MKSSVVDVDQVQTEVFLMVDVDQTEVFLVHIKQTDSGVDKLKIYPNEHIYFTTSKFSLKQNTLHCSQVIKSVILADTKSTPC